MWMAQNGVNIPQDIETVIVHHEELGQTVVLAAVNSGYFALSSFIEFDFLLHYESLIPLIKHYVNGINTM